MIVRYICFTLICICLANASISQTPASRGLDFTPDNTATQTGKTYALIVGISKYQSSACYPTLHYADVDAREFYQYLISKTGGNVDTERVVLLLNDQATQSAIWEGFNSIKNRLKKNDAFYIYFSGHGDAESTDLVYLLAYNAPPGCEKNLYEAVGGVINIHSLKSTIKEITMNAKNPATVILITDACRSNELPPGGEGGRQTLYEEMFTKSSGEIQFVSCLANQQSYEDARWGGGRGLFSWHLVNGLKGMADNDPEDGIVTPSELSTYVTSNVKKDSYDSVTHTSRQTPKYFCPDKNEGFVIAKVNKDAKEQLAAQLKVGSATSGTKAFAVNKGVNLGMEMKRQGYEELYKKFITAINEKRLIDPAENNAMGVLQEILAANITPELKSDLKFELSGRLMDDVTKVMNEYLHASTNNNNYTYDYFNNAARKLRAFINISDSLYYNPRDLKVNLLFLEGHAKWHSPNTADLRESLRKVDSAVALKPQASFLYNLKGLMHINLRQYKEAEATFRKGIALAPNWLYPYHNLAITFADEDMYDSARIYFFKALTIDPQYQTTYEGIAGLYNIMGKTDSAIHYAKKGLIRDHTDPHLWIDLGNYYSSKKDWHNALSSYYNSIHYDSSDYKSYKGILSAYLKTSSADSIKYYQNKMMSVAADNPQMYIEMGLIFQEYNYDTSALEMYEKSIDIDNKNPLAWLYAARICKKLKQYETAEKCLQSAITIDSAADNGYLYSDLGDLYYSMDSLDKALAALNRSIQFDPHSPYNCYTYNEIGNTYYLKHQYASALGAYENAIRLKPDYAQFYDNYAFVSLENKDAVSAEKYYRKAIEADAKFSSSYYGLAKLLAARAQKAEALKMLELAVTYGQYSKKTIMEDGDFTSLKAEPAFMSILLKAQ